MGKLNLANHFSGSASCPSPKKIWNREYAAQRLAAELAHLDRDSSYRFAVVMVEIAGFSRGMASRLGYATSNELWPTVMDFLTDELGSEGICSRLGEEEFLLILPGANAEKANVLAALLRERWGNETASSTMSLDVTVAAAAWVTKGGSIQAVFAVVDEALDEERQRKNERHQRIHGGGPPVAGMVPQPRSRTVLTGNS